MNGDEHQQHPAPGQTDGNWTYKPESTSEPAYLPRQEAPAQPAPLQDITWTASEFIARHKGTRWYLTLAAGATLLAVVVYLISRDFITVGAIVIAVSLFGVAAGRKPRILTYHLNN